MEKDTQLLLAQLDLLLDQQKNQPVSLLTFSSQISAAAQSYTILFGQNYEELLQDQSNMFTAANMLKLRQEMELEQVKQTQRKQAKDLKKLEEQMDLQDSSESNESAKTVLLKLNGDDSDNYEISSNVPTVPKMSVKTTQINQQILNAKDQLSNKEISLIEYAALNDADNKEQEELLLYEDENQSSKPASVANNVKQQQKKKERRSEREKKGDDSTVSEISQKPCLLYDEDVLQHKHYTYHNDKGDIKDKTYTHKGLPLECPGRVRQLFTSLNKDVEKGKIKCLIHQCDLGEFREQTIESINTLIKQTHTHNALEILKQELPKNEAFLDQIELNQWVNAEENDYTLYRSKETLVSCYAAINTTLQAVEKVLDLEYQNVYALVRPPGHHASSTKFGGFCFFNNLAIGIKYYQQRKPENNVLIVDWDLHAGDGTMEIFDKDPKVFMLSLHADENHYPFTKQQHLNDTKNIVNIDFDTSKHQIDNNSYWQTFVKIFPFLYAISKADIIFISSGFDLLKDDPLGRQKCTPTLFTRLVYFIKKTTRNSIPLVLVHEGGYCRTEQETKGLIKGFIACLQGFTDTKSSNQKPFSAKAKHLTHTQPILKEIDIDYDLKLKVIRRFSEKLYPIKTDQASTENSFRSSILQSLMKDEYNENKVKIEVIIDGKQECEILSESLRKVFEKKEIQVLTDFKSDGNIQDSPNHIHIHFSSLANTWTSLLYLPVIDKEAWKQSVQKEGNQVEWIDGLQIEPYERWERQHKIEFVKLGFCTQCIISPILGIKEIEQCLNEEFRNNLLEQRNKDLQEVDLTDDYGLHLDAHVQQKFTGESMDVE